MFEHFKKFTLMEETNSVATDSTCNNALLGEVFYRSIRKEHEYEIEIPFEDKRYTVFVTLLEGSWFPFQVSEVRIKKPYKIKNSIKKKVKALAAEFAIKNFA